MLTLQPTDKLQVTLASAVSTDMIAEFADGTIEQRNETTASTFDLGEAGGLLVRLAIVAVGGGQTVTLKKSVRGNRTYQITPAIVLTSGYALYYDLARGLYVMDTSGRVRFSTA
jgi:hypothetical protein